MSDSLLDGPAAQTQMLSTGTLLAVLHMTRQLARSRQLLGAPALWCAANLGLLLTNASSSTGDAYTLPPSPHLCDPRTAEALCAAVMQLLAAARQQAHGRHEQQQTQLATALQQLWPVGSQSHLLQLLGVLAQPGQDEAGMLVFAGYCIHLVQDLPELAAATTAGTALAGASPVAGGNSGSSSSSSSSGVSALNALAFAPSLLPAIWRWLAVHLGLPLEAPLEASLGLDVAALRGGYKALSPPHACVLGVFCRWGCKHLCSSCTMQQQAVCTSAL